MSSEEVISDACAACGQGGDGLKKCTSCKQVKYCGRECQASDWKNHKRACKKKAAELHDEALFRQPPRRDDCPICCLILPVHAGSVHYTSCCGRTVCGGCLFMALSVGKLRCCPFCRNARPEMPSDKYMIEGYSKRVEANDAGAMNVLGEYYNEGGAMERDPAKARELWERAGTLGNARANFLLAQMYLDGDGVARDLKKMEHYLELAAMGGNVNARYDLGRLEIESNDRPPGSDRRALNHFAIAAKDGHGGAMKKITTSKQFSSSQEYEETLRAFVNVTKEMRSEQRDKADEMAKILSGDPENADFVDRESADRASLERVAHWMRANGHL